MSELELIQDIQKQLNTISEQSQSQISLVITIIILIVKTIVAVIIYTRKQNSEKLKRRESKMMQLKFMNKSVEELKGEIEHKNKIQQQQQSEDNKK